MLYEFYGETCPHCVVMKPLVEKLEKELGVTVDKREVWNNEENAQLMEKLSKGNAQGVPYFLNTESGKELIGSVDEADLRAWMQGE